MNTNSMSEKSAFGWNAGRWFGGEFGGTAWMVPLGVVLMATDVVAAVACLASFVILNAWGLLLWSRREKLTAYAAYQQLLFGMLVAYTLIAIIINSRGIKQAPTPFGIVPTELPYWIIALPVVAMLVCFCQERAVQRTPA